MRLNFFGLLILVVVVGAAVGGAYGAGIVTGKGQAVPALAAPSTGSTSGAAGAALSAGTAGRVTLGTVGTVNGNIVTVTSAAGGTSQVTIDENTRIEKTVEGTVADLQPGARIAITGPQGADGAAAASSIQIVTATAAFPSQTQGQAPARGQGQNGRTQGGNQAPAQ